jgi:uncharacterized protein YlxW (UPF0749 family)
MGGAMPSSLRVVMRGDAWSHPNGVMGVEAWMGRSGEDRLRRLLIFYDPMQAVASELRRVADSLERLEISAEASVQIVSALRRLEEQLERLNTLMEKIYNSISDLEVEEEKTKKKGKRKVNGGQTRIDV